MTDATVATADEADIRPVVRTGGTGQLGFWLFGGILLIGGALLFNALDARREAMVASTSVPTETSGGMISAPPPLALPPDYSNAFDQSDWLRGPRRFTTVRPSVAPSPQVITRVVERPVQLTPPAPSSPQLMPQLDYTPPRPVIIERPELDEPAAAAAAGRDGDDRVFAGHLRNPALTVPQGTIIAAVLETALDSTRAGGVRAIVSRDVRSYDGSRVLIPRGSRLYGEYTSDVLAGQNRALVRWQRLTRPDAVIIDLDSPAADPLGRAGVRGKVDTHFFERFGGAILQSILDIGVGVATRSVSDDTVIVGLPGSTQQVTGQQQLLNQVQPTLRVRQGTSVSVFVARDLDFSTVDR